MTNARHGVETPVAAGARPALHARFAVTQPPANQAPVNQAPVAFPPVSWWLVTWRARVHEASTGDVDARLSTLADAIGHSEAVGGLAGVHRLAASGVSFEFWFEARTEREAAGGARIALRHACRAAGVGDPTAPSRTGPVDVMLMFEEVPALRRDDS
jgi:hypothetical protein